MAGAEKDGEACRTTEHTIFKERTKETGTELV